MKLHPDKTAGLPSVKRKEYEEQLKIISGVYDTVNTEGKFMLFWDSWKQQHEFGSTDKAPESSSDKAPKSSSHRFKRSYGEEMSGDDEEESSDDEEVNSDSDLPVPQMGFVNVFIHVNISNILALSTLGDKKQRFTANIDFSQVASELNNYSKRYTLQVGVTYREAVRIANQHSHRDFIAIIQAAIKVSELSFDRRSEKELFPSFAGSTEQFLWLPNGTNLSGEHILSIQLMHKRDYKNTLRFTSFDKLPRGLNIFSNLNSLAKPIESRSSTEKTHHHLNNQHASHSREDSTAFLGVNSRAIVGHEEVRVLDSKKQIVLLFDPNSIVLANDADKLVNDNALLLQSVINIILGDDSFRSPSVQRIAISVGGLLDKKQNPPPNYAKTLAILGKYIASALSAIPNKQNRSITHEAQPIMDLDSAIRHHAGNTELSSILCFSEKYLSPAVRPDEIDVSISMYLWKKIWTKPGCVIMNPGRYGFFSMVDGKRTALLDKELCDHLIKLGG